jgi:hypothetical protein
MLNLDIPPSRCRPYQAEPSGYAQSDDEGRLVAGPEKMNTAAPIPALTLTIHSVQHFEPTADSDGTEPLLVCAGESERTAHEHRRHR